MRKSLVGILLCSLMIATLSGCGTIRANTRHVGEDKVKVVVEKNERYEF